MVSVARMEKRHRSPLAWVGAAAAIPGGSGADVLAAAAGVRAVRPPGRRGWGRHLLPCWDSLCCLSETKAGVLEESRKVPWAGSWESLLVGNSSPRLERGQRDSRAPVMSTASPGAPRGSRTSPRGCLACQLYKRNGATRNTPRFVLLKIFNPGNQIAPF